MPDQKYWRQLKQIVVDFGVLCWITDSYAEMEKAYKIAQMKILGPKISTQNA